MARDRIYTSERYRTVIDSLKEDDVLGLKIAEGKDIFMLAVAMGIADPTPLKKKVGLFLNTALKTADRALIECMLLGTAEDDSQIDELADYDKSADLCEQCAETGYGILLQKFNDAGRDEEVFERRLIKELELLFTKNVAADI